MGVDIDGLTDLFEDLDDLQDSYGDDGPTWVTGTNVEYAIYLEYGTKHMDPKPFFRPVVAEVKTQGVESFLRDNTELGGMADIAGTEEFVAVFAIAIEARVKEVITKKGLIDTGTLRASIAATPIANASNLPTAEDMPDDPPADYAKRVVSQDIEVEA